MYEMARIQIQCIWVHAVKKSSFLRRDEIDSSHYPVFHQVEAVRLLGRPAEGGRG